MGIPLVRQLVTSWSITGVLRALTPTPYEPMHSQASPVEYLTRKTLFLVVVTARWRSCLQALSVKPGHWRFENHGVLLVSSPSFLAKTQTLASVPAEIFFSEISLGSSVDEFRKWCPFRMWRWTKDICLFFCLFILSQSPPSSTPLAAAVVGG